MSHLFGPFHDPVFGESLKHLLEEDTELLLYQGDGDLRDGQSGHLSDDVSHSAGALHYHTGRAVGDGIVDGLQNQNQVSVSWPESSPSSDTSETQHQSVAAKAASHLLLE